MRLLGLYGFLVVSVESRIESFPQIFPRRVNGIQLRVVPVGIVAAE